MVVAFAFHLLSNSSFLQEVVGDGCPRDGTSGGTKEDMNEFLPPFEEKHDKLVQLLQSCPYMDSRNKRYTTQYIESFFQECKNKKSMAYALRKVDY